MSTETTAPERITVPWCGHNSCGVPSSIPRERVTLVERQVEHDGHPSGSTTAATLYVDDVVLGTICDNGVTQWSGRYQEKWSAFGGGNSLYVHHDLVWSDYARSYLYASKEAAIAAVIRNAVDSAFHWRMSLHNAGQAPRRPVSA